MHVVNVMFGRGRGGIEQAFLDYTDALRLSGHDVTAILQPGANIVGEVKASGAPFHLVGNWGFWDVTAVSRLRNLLQKIAPDAVITHGNRALRLMCKAAEDICPVIGVAHNYNIKHLALPAAVFAITIDLCEKVEALRIAEGAPAVMGNRQPIFHIPNMVRLDGGFVKPARKSVVTIGAMGRFVKKKGFDVYIEALQILRERGVLFKAILAGEGDEKYNLLAQAQYAGLEDFISFPGWVEDKKAFFESIDVFCLPSLHEPFGIVLLEAFANKVPVITTDAEGPRDIVTHGVDGLMIPRGDPNAIAQAIMQMIDDESAAREFANTAFNKVKEHYTLPVIGARISDALKYVCTK